MCRYWPPGSTDNILPGLLTPRSFCYIRKLNLLWASHYSYSRNLSALTLYLQKGHQNTVQSQKQGASITGSCWACEMWVFFFQPPPAAHTDQVLITASHRSCLFQFSLLHFLATLWTFLLSHILLVQATKTQKRHLASVWNTVGETEG